MNEILIDSHIFLWLLQEPTKIGHRAILALKNADIIYISLATIYELTLKYKNGKLSFSPQELIPAISELGAKQLDITSKHLISLVGIDSLTKDPFDLLLMSQAKSEGIFLLTADSLMLKNQPDYVIDARK